MCLRASVHRSRFNLIGNLRMKSPPLSELTISRALLSKDRGSYKMNSGGSSGRECLATRNPARPPRHAAHRVSSFTISSLIASPTFRNAAGICSAPFTFADEQLRWYFVVWALRDRAFVPELIGSRFRDRDLVTGLRFGGE